LNEEIVPEMMPQCKLVESSSTVKSKMRSELAKAGEGKNHPKMRAAQKKRRVEKRAQASKDVVDEKREKMRENGLFLCNMKCPQTNRYCRGVYLYPTGLEKHVAKGKHKFPGGIRARDRLMHLASKPGGLVEVGSRPDRQKNDSLFSQIVASEDGARGEEDARCFGRFNRKEGVTPYHKPEQLIAVLLELYNEEPKLRSNEMRERMREMKDENDGGLLFCWSKRDVTGLLLTEDQIQAWINSETQRKKKKGKGQPTETEKEQARLVQQVQNN
jgi:hypothetical protein